VDAGNGKWVVSRKALNHTVVNGSEIHAFDSYDKDATRVNDRLICTTPTHDTRNFVAGVMGNGRLGIIASRRDSGQHQLPTAQLGLPSEGERGALNRCLGAACSTEAVLVQLRLIRPLRSTAAKIRGTEVRRGGCLIRQPDGASSGAARIRR
jgi:hypothetical protein